MADQNGWAGQLTRRIGNIFDEIGDSRPAQALATLAVAMPPHIDGMGGVTVLGEVIEKVNIPAPGPMHLAVNKKQRRRMGAAGWMLGDHFELHTSSLIRSADTRSGIRRAEGYCSRRSCSRRSTTSVTWETSAAIAPMAART